MQVIVHFQQEIKRKHTCSCPTVKECLKINRRIYMCICIALITFYITQDVFSISTLLPHLLLFIAFSGMILYVKWDHQIIYFNVHFPICLCTSILMASVLDIHFSGSQRNLKGIYKRAYSVFFKQIYFHQNWQNCHQNK